MIKAHENGRKIPKEDKIFALNGRAKAMIAAKGKDKVINATIGALLDDEGQLLVLSSVVDAIKQLKPVDFAEYAPIGGTADFKKAVRKAAFGDWQPKSPTEVCATPGGTGAIRNTIANYSDIGDKVLTTDWFWGPYKTVAGEIGRDLETYRMFDEDGKYDMDSMKSKIAEILKEQDSLVILINTPAHNPTGYSLSDSDWDSLIKILNEACRGGRQITLFVDAAYVDFAGDEKKYRSFLPKLEDFNENVLPIIGYSASKTLTMYGMRCGAMICLAHSKEEAEEFKQVTEFSSRGTWSNSVHAGQTLLANIYSDPEMLAEVAEEREGFRDMLIRRGRTFSEALKDGGITGVPFDAGFFACIECDDPDAVSAAMEKQGIFVVPLAKGVRISVASISEEKCKTVAKALAGVLK